MAVTACSVACFSQHYTAWELFGNDPPPEGSYESMAKSIGPAGTIYIGVTAYPSAGHAASKVYLLDKNNDIIDAYTPPVLAGGHYTEFIGMGPNAQVYYNSAGANGYLHGMIADWSDPSGLRVDPNWSWSQLGGVSPSGQATIAYINSHNVYQPAFYGSGSITDVVTGSLGVFAGPVASDANGNLIVGSFHGFYYDGNGNYHYQDQIHFGPSDENGDLVPIPGGFGSAEMAQALANGTAVGSAGHIGSDFGFAPDLPALWTGGWNSLSVQLLPTNGHPGRGLSINSQGVVVGSVTGMSAVAWIKDANGVYQLHDLNDYLPQGSGWHLDSAEQVLDDGRIFGFGTYQGQKRAFVLVPVPEPATAAALAFGGLCLVVRRRRK